MTDAEKIAELRRKFTKKYVDPPPPRFHKFDPRDVTRISNDDLYALSFIHWKKEVIDDAVEMVADVLQWRKENGVTDLSVDSIGRNIFQKGLVYVHGRDHNGLRVLSLLARLQTKDEKEICRKLFMFWLERIQRNEPGKHIIFILDTYKTSMANVDLGLIRFIIDSFTSYFPDLLERIIILDMPWIMNAIWNIVKQWMTEEQRSRTVFCGRKDLHKYIPLEQLPTSMAGKNDWTYSFPPFPDDLSQDVDFLKDPNNYPEGSQEEDSSKQANGDVIMSDKEDLMNNNHSQQEEESLHVSKDAKHLVSPKESARTAIKDDLPSTSGLQNSHEVSAKDVFVAETSFVNRIPRSQNDDSAKIKKTASFDLGHVSDHDQENEIKKEGLPRRRIKSHQNLRNATSAERDLMNVSFKSTKEASDTSVPASNSRVKMDTSEIKLGDMLVMSPVSELVFRRTDDDNDSPKPDRLYAFIKLRNPNSANSENNALVAYKVKTTSPERYHVKPSVGVLEPGASIQIRIHLTLGYEMTAGKDRFLLIYKQFPTTDNKSPSHGDVVRFWKKNNDKSSHYEHKLRVKFDDSVSQGARNEENGADVQRSSPVPFQPSSSQQSFLSSDKLPEESELNQLQQQVAVLNRKLTKLEGDTRWMRRRMRHSMGLLLVLVFLICLVLYEVSVLSHAIQQPTSCRE